MFIENEKKLKRGLKDISPLFKSVETSVKKTTPALLKQELQILNVSSPDSYGDSLFFNAFFASQLASPNRPCSLVSLNLPNSAESVLTQPRLESFGRYLNRHFLEWNTLSDILEKSLSQEESGSLDGGVLFLDFEYQNLFYAERIIPLLDKWILLLKPTLESLTEGYKMMKAGFSINKELEVFVVFEGQEDNAKSAFIFEQFSSLAFKNFGTSLSWLGWFDPSGKTEGFVSKLNLEQLLFRSRMHSSSFEKIAMAHWLKNIEKEEKKDFACNSL